MSMKKKIFITIQYMELGGAERSLLGLLDAIDYSLYDVDLFIHRHTGELMEFINPNTNLLPEIPIYTTLTRPIVQIIKEGYWRIALGRLQAKMKARKYKGEKSNESIFQYVANATTRFLPVISEKEYDLAISFLQPHNIVREKIKARKKVAWIHTDYSTVSVDLEVEMPAWGSYDHIVAISESSKIAFCKSFPSLESKIVVIENILSPQFVKEQAKKDLVEFNDPINILTVGRFCYPKAFDNAVRICAQLIKMGVMIKWYAIGYGDRKSIEDAIIEYGMKEHFIILGKKSNPYPYMEACDIYIQPSRYEGKAVTVREAQILGKPVAITAFPTSQSQLTDCVDGVIVPMDVEGAAIAIKQLIEDKHLQESLVDNCCKTDYGNYTEVEKIYNFMNLKTEFI